MHLGLQDEDEVFVLLPARPRGSLCERARGCVDAYACQPRPPTAGAPDWQPRIWRKANTRANKWTLVQSELRMRWHSSASSFAPRDGSLLACRQSANNQTRKKQKNLCWTAFYRPFHFLPCSMLYLMHRLIKLLVWRINFWNKIMTGVELRACGVQGYI